MSDSPPTPIHYPADMDGYLLFLKDIRAHEEATKSGITVLGFSAWLELRKHNPNHDPHSGRFASGSGHGGGAGAGGGRGAGPLQGFAGFGSPGTPGKVVTKPAKTPRTQSPEAVTEIRQKLADYHEGDRKVAALAAVHSAIDEKQAVRDGHVAELKRLGEDLATHGIFTGMSKRREIVGQMEKVDKKLEKSNADLEKEQKRVRDEVTKLIAVGPGEPSMALVDRSNGKLARTTRLATTAAAVAAMAPHSPVTAGIAVLGHLNDERNRRDLKKTTREAADWVEKVTAAGGTPKVRYSTHPLSGLDNPRPHYVQSGLFNQQKVSANPNRHTDTGRFARRIVGLPAVIPQPAGGDIAQHVVPGSQRGPRGFGFGNTRIVGLSPLGRATLGAAAASSAARAPMALLNAHMQGRFANGKTLFLHPSNSSAEVAHELGHMLEHQVPGWNASAQAFLKHRVGDEPLTQMRSLPGGKGRYDRSEYGRKDNFDKAFGDSAHYVGKDHGKRASEVTAMGLEKLFTDPVGFARHDPEHAKFILGMLDGSLRMNKKRPARNP
jgi:hypothetical protein